MASILIIDDSAYMRGKIRSILKKASHSIQEAEDGVTGIQMASAQPFDLILLDIIMPGMDGLKILGLLHERKSTVPVIIITADIQESISSQCRDLGAFAVIHKPPREEDLLSAVSRALDRQEMPSS
jgi:CheY-like chemotaxis protein